MAISWSVLILVLGLAIAALIQLAQGQKNKKVRIRGRNFGLIIAAIGLIALVVPAVSMGIPFLAEEVSFGFLAAGVTADGVQPTSVGVDGKLCAVEDTTVTLSAEDKYTVATTGGNHRYRVSSDGGVTFAPEQILSDDGTFTASPGNVIEILWNNETDTSAFGILDFMVVPCAGTETFAARTVNNGTLTTRIFNEEGNLIGSVGGFINETLVAGDVVNLDMELQGQFEREFPHGFVLVVEYNKTTIDEVDFILDGVNIQETAVPTVFAPTLGAESSKQAFEVAPSISNVKQIGTIMIDADDNTDPQASTSDILFTYYPKDYFVNRDFNGRVDEPAAEDEDNNAIRTLLTYRLYID